MGRRVAAWVGAAGLILAACSKTPAPTATSSSAVTAAPTPAIDTFVVYAADSVTLGSGAHSAGGDIGVATSNGSSPQLTVGSQDGLDPARTLYAPAVSVGHLAQVGAVDTNTLTNSGGQVGAQASYPSPMPPLPAIFASTPGTSNVTVAQGHQQTLSPGNYGALTDDGTVLLDPGTYSFASVTLGNSAQLQALQNGSTRILIAGTLATGTQAQIFPAGQAAGALTISVSGTDGANGSPPAVSVGASSQVTSLLSAPNGTVSLGNGVQATGALAGLNCIAGSNVVLNFQSGFPDAQPLIDTFVAYAQTSLALGTGDHTVGGDVGVAAASSGGGAQLTVGSQAGLDPAHTLYASSVSIGSQATLGDVMANTLTSSGGLFGAEAPYPASAMPPLPGAPAGTSGSANVTVAQGHQQTLSPGSYGALSDNGVVLLNPGTYSFASVTLGNSAQLQALQNGATSILITGALSTGTQAQIFPVGQPAGQLTIAVAGADGANGSPPAASLGAGTQILALLTAPNGTLSLGNNAQGTGAFAGSAIVAGSNVTLTFQTGFAPCQDVVCAASDACHAAGACMTSTGFCSNPPAADGTACAGTNLCEQTYTCQAGVCTGSNPVRCAAAGQCSAPGTCDPATGACSNPPAPDGTSCDDGDACTQSDTCQGGACTGGTPVTCVATGQCSVPGTCDPATGACSNPPAPDGTSCDDGDACTQVDTCQGGACTGSDPVTCVAMGQCYAPGTCDPTTGACSNPVAANGTSCDDGDACTQVDTCQGGACTGSDPVTCAAAGQCSAPGTCDPTTGACSNPNAPDGTSCDDGDACTQVDTCQGGACTGGAPVTCAAAGPCSVPGTCDPATGACSNPSAPDGTSCSDGNACTTGDTCQGGACTGGAPVTCAASDSCHQAGSCDPTTGACSNPIAANGTPCGAGNACTTGDSCQNGTCQAGTAPVLTGNPDACTLETCDPVHGVVAHTCSPIDRSVGTVLANATSFLYSGDNPVQTGVAAGTILPASVAVLRGHVYQSNGSALPGVTITIANHPELGTTLTQGDGGFDMAVNGGQQLVVNYALSGYLPVQRRVQAPWQDYAVVKDVVMIPRDPNVTEIDLTDTTSYQVAQGSVETDTSGTRQATILVPPGTQATMTTPSGTTPLTAMHVRATEYTVGSNGPSAMPGDLPPASAYTYAVELSADEEQAAGATGLTFSQPLPVYLQDFIGFPAGTTIPAGSYNPNCSGGGCSNWIPSTSGIVLQIVGVTGGVAAVDVTGDGVADTGAALTSLGITTDELSELVELYPVGQLLWRVPIPHFTSWDFNLGAGPPPGGGPPGGPPPGGPPPGPDPCKNANASIVDCQDQSLGETLAVVGTPYSLHYESDRQLGRQPSLEIPLSGATIPGPVLDIELDVSVAGRTFTEYFPPQPDLTTTFIWDGTDAFGRRVQGDQPISVTVGNSYKVAYLQTNTFGQWGNSVTLSATSQNLPVDDFAQDQVNVNRYWNGAIGVWDSVPVGLGGWDLNVHHAYDPGAHTIHFGDGTDLTPASLPGVIETVAGNGPKPGIYADGISALQATVTPLSVTVGPDGSLYIGDAATCIRRVDPQGIIHTVAGTCSGNGPAYSGDGGPATAARIGDPYDMVLGCDGSLYFVDGGNHRIRRIDPSGIITTVVGTGASGDTGDGGPATAATLNFPTSLDLAPDGTMFIADQEAFSVRRVTPDGVIGTVAGYGTFYGQYPDQDEVPATQSAIEPGMVRVMPDGSLLVSDAYGYNPELRRITTDGIIHDVISTPGGVAGMSLAKDSSVYLLTAVPVHGVNEDVVQQLAPDGSLSTVAGPGAPNVLGDNGPATSAAISPAGITVAPDDTLYIADKNNNRLRAAAPPLPGFSSDGAAFTFASTDGTQIYEFDGTGRHLQTLNALTGAVLYQFAYDSAGRLASVTDVDGDVTQINHDAGGNPVSLVGPFGQTTTLAADGNGYLASVTDPAGNTTQCTYSPTGLMSTMTDARGGLHQFAYDSVGRLTEDQDAAGGSLSLARTDLQNGDDVQVTTALGRQTTLQTTLSPTTGTFARLNTFPDGTQASLQFTTSSVTTTTVPDGTTTVETDTPDPRFGMLSPVQAFTTTTPSGLASTQTESRTVTLSSGALSSLVDQTTLNGNTWTKAFNASTSTWTTTSPVGRTSTMTIDLAGRPTLTSVPNVTPFASTYDAHGRLVTLTQGARTWTNTYDPQGYLASTTDPLDHTIGFVNDALGRPTTTALADSRQLSTTYDPDNNVTALTLPSSATHAFSYTPVDLLASYTPPSVSGVSTPSTQYTYDADRELTTLLRPDGVTVGYGYDSSGRLQSTTYPQGALTRTYSPTTGQLASLLAPSGEALSYAYDGFLRTGVTWSGPVVGTLSLGFDKNFRITSQTVAGTSLPFGYDADGLLTGAGALALTLDAHNGRLTGTTLGAITDAYTYDADGLFATYVASYSGSPLYQESVTRDADGRITQKTEVLASTSHVWGYTYDANGRLTDVTEDGNFASHYAYDADDNRTTYTNTSGSVNPTYDAQDRLLTYGDATYAYTANGERTSKTDGTGTTAYTYDALGNLLDVSLPGGEAITYIADGENRRVGKEVGGTLTTGFLYKDALNVVAQLDGSGNLVARYVFGSKPNVPDYFTTSAGTFRILSDHLGSPRLIVNASTGATVEEIDYDEFGNVTNDTAPGTIPFGFAGGLYDRDTGLVRFGARDYDASTGRWTSKDPLRFEGRQMNLYVYAANDPVNIRDATGRASGDCDFICSAASFTVCTAVGVGTSSLGGAVGVAIGLDCWLASYVTCSEICKPPAPPPPPPPPAPPVPPPGPPVCQ